jgi:ketosteroid isomerase-like protein
MKRQPTAKTDKDQIRQIIEQWAEATRTGRQDDVLSNHAPDVLIFDPLPPLKYEGAAAYRKSWDEWQPETEGPGLFDLHELQITAGRDVGFAHAFIHCGGTRPDGSTFEDWVRTTICLRKIGSKWLIIHQHTSMPVGVSRDEP